MSEEVFDLEEGEESVLEGDAPFRRGSARAALAHRDFALVWWGSLASNVGTWMQNAALGALAFKLTHSSGFVALLGFAQLGPLLALSLIGGMLADSIDRRWLLVATQVEQGALSFLLAFFAAQHHPSHAALFFCVLGIGIGNALFAPTMSAVQPQLVGKKDLPGAVSLQSVQLNLSRVIGPVIGGLIIPFVHAWGVFFINALTYLFAIVTLLMVTIPRPYPDHSEQGIKRALGGFRIARHDGLVGRCLIMITTFSFFCLCFIGLLPVIAGDNLGMNVTGTAYGILFASFGSGAALGAIAVGTVWVDTSKAKIVRVGMPIFGVFLGVLAALRTPALAFPVVFFVGFFYFATITSLSTVLQNHLSEQVRGRVMALWIMGFGGTVPFGLLAGGWLADHTSVSTVLVVGVVFAFLLTAAIDLRGRESPIGMETAP
ncbi:MAG TPA: MFS transporter [Acidimicrobiales bacterium]|nr:MFS transporter [Acidimicrobiales bacterium]